MSKIDDITSMKVDRTKIRVFNSFEERDAADREYWKSLTPEELLTALEMMRQIAYGYDEDQRGLQGFFEVAERKKS
jgi:hypothetical protein